MIFDHTVIDLARAVSVILGLLTAGAIVRYDMRSNQVTSGGSMLGGIFIIIGLQFYLIHQPESELGLIAVMRNIAFWFIFAGLVKFVHDEKVSHDHEG